MKEIKKMKAEGKLIETRDYIDPAHSKKRRQHFCVMAKNLEIDYEV